LTLQIVVLVSGVTPTDCIRFFDFDHNRIGMLLYRDSHNKQSQLLLYATESMQSLYCNRLSITTEMRASWELAHSICTIKQKCNKIEYQEKIRILKPLVKTAFFDAVTANNLKSAFTKDTNPYFISQSIRAVKVIDYTLLMEPNQYLTRLLFFYSIKKEVILKLVKYIHLNGLKRVLLSFGQKIRNYTELIVILKHLDMLLKSPVLI